MKRLVSVLVVCLFVLSTVGAQPVSETKTAQPLEVQFAVMAGPTGFSSVALAQNGGRLSDELKVNLQVFSVTERGNRPFGQRGTGFCGSSVQPCFHPLQQRIEGEARGSHRKRDAQRSFQ